MNPATFVTPTLRRRLLIYLSRRNDRGSKEKAMTTHITGTREEWLAARLALNQAEKELTRRSDEWRGNGRRCRGFGSTRGTRDR